MDYIVYRTNTHEYFAGYDSVDRPTWVAADEVESAIKYADYSDANIEADKLWRIGFVTDIHSIRYEHVNDEW